MHVVGDAALNCEFVDCNQVHIVELVVYRIAISHVSDCELNRHADEEAKSGDKYSSYVLDGQIFLRHLAGNLSVDITSTDDRSGAEHGVVDCNAAVLLSLTLLQNVVFKLRLVEASLVGRILPCLFCLIALGHNVVCVIELTGAESWRKKSGTFNGLDACRPLALEEQIGRIPKGNNVLSTYGPSETNVSEGDPCEEVQCLTFHVAQSTERKVDAHLNESNH